MTLPLRRLRFIVSCFFRSGNGSNVGGENTFPIVCHEVLRVSEFTFVRGSSVFFLCMVLVHDYCLFSN